MVPFHESDVAENRWREDEWRQFELWEQIELRLRRKRFWIIFSVFVLFLSILSIPIIQDRAPKWTAESAMRKLAVRVNQMKVDAAALGVPLRLRLESSANGPAFVIERVSTCMDSADSTGAAPQEWTRGILFANEEVGKHYAVLSTDDAKRFGMTRIVDLFCYEPMPKLEQETGEISAAIGVASVKDLADGRLDRLAFLNFSGLSAEIDFD